MPYRAVIFDFYGTLAEREGAFEPISAVLARFGHVARDDVIWRFFNDGIDGIEHDEHSRSRDHYVAWQRRRVVDLLRECEVPASDHDAIADAFRASNGAGRMVAYPEAATVLTELRARGVRLTICSNWDWDLREAVAASGLHDHVDDMISSAWVGARKPHPRIYDHTLERLGHDPADVLFVGDTWNCDVAGPAAHGMTPVYVRRSHREPDHTRPHDDGHPSPRESGPHESGTHESGTHEFDDLVGLLGLV